MAHRLAVTLLRHGLTDENVKKQYIGWSDPPLCEKGRQELIDSSKAYPAGVLIVSDKKRCKETAAILYPNKPYEVCPGFRELHFGKWEGKTYEELKSDPEYCHWLDCKQEPAPPGGESFADFQKRVLEAWKEQIIRRFDCDGIHHLVLITHGGPIRLLLSYFAPEEKPMWEWPVSHGEGYTFIWEEAGALRRGLRCTLLQAVPLTGKGAG
ncbi:histidine phosphatase family protein [Fictibacillus gelatini]|uniref:histidine phosphatase family protein n=1 Tax=Fictibacillus gelatini TaxID=225985 RepID=UPI000400CDAC|nr:histidine phosphatase family protein [Fictibacillus gelatini]